VSDENGEKMRKKRENNEGGRCFPIPMQSMQRMQQRRERKRKSTNYALQTQN